jgi:hypothetical protein
VSEKEEQTEDVAGKSEPPAVFLLALEGTNTVRKYPKVQSLT